MVIAIIIRATSKGSAVFKQERAGKNGKPFTMYKFRTMRTDVDPFGASPKSGTDPRLTKIGIFLREYSLDELPQLFNVLKGEMSTRQILDAIELSDRKSMTERFLKPALEAGLVEMTIPEKPKSQNQK